VVAAYFVAMVWVGLRLHKQSGSDIRSFFTGDGAISWWLVAASLIATSFAADTPLWVTGLVRQHGVHAVWQYWSYFLGAGLAVFLFARMWRRSGVLTDMELLELRYSGKGAAFIRGFTASWGAVVINVITIGWVTKAMQTILAETLGLTPAASNWALAGIVLVTLAYCAVSGLLGVVVTDAIQLVLALVGTLALAAIVVIECGGPAQMVASLQSLPEWSGKSLAIGPEIGSLAVTPPGALSFWNFVAFIGFAWLSLAYCQGYICQRMLACRNQRDASKAMLGYTLFYWGFLAWPWIIVALGSLILLTPEQMAGKNAEAAYPLMAMTFLPPGLRGVLFVALVAAFMSTVATLINFGASYIVNDIYRRFMARNRSDRHYVSASRLVTAVTAIAGALLAYASGSVLELLQLAGVFAIGTVLVPALRWFWWRMTPWGEFTAFITSVVLVILIVTLKLMDPWVASVFPLHDGQGKLLPFSTAWDYYGLRILVVMIPTTLAAIVVSLLTPPTSDAMLREFITRLRPPRAAWAGVARRLGLDYREGEPLWWVLAGWVTMTLSIAGLLYGCGWLTLGKPLAGALALVIGLACLVACLRLSAREDG
jgi:Na+/proline symporter